MDKEKVKNLLLVGHKGARLGMSEEELSDFAEDSFSYLLNAIR